MQQQQVTGTDFIKRLGAFERDGVGLEGVREYFHELGFDFSAYEPPARQDSSVDCLAEGSSPGWGFSDEAGFYPYKLPRREPKRTEKPPVPVFIAEGRLPKQDIYRTELAIKLFVEVTPIGADQVYGSLSPLATDADGNVRQIGFVSVSGFIGSDPYINGWALDDIVRKTAETGAQPLIDPETMIYQN